MPASSFAAYVIQLVGNCSPDEDQAWPTVTPRILLSHTSSLANFAFLEPDRKMHLYAQPGKAYRYSGEGLNIVQLLIEQKKDRPLDQLMSEAIFNPLSMSRAGMIYRRNLKPTSPIASMKTKSSCRRRRFPARASGNMTSSAEDLVRFASALLKPQVEIRTLHQFVFVESEPDGEEAACICLAYGMGWGLLTKTPYGPAFFQRRSWRRRTKSQDLL